MRRPLAATILSIGLVAAAAAPPALAATPDFGPVVTVKGHVRDAAGDPVKGIKVESSCGCDFDGGGSIPSHLLGKDTTDARGYYSFQVRKKVALNISANDKSEKYLAAGRDSGSTKKRGDGYVIDLVVQRASELAGTVRDTHGDPVDSVYIRVYDAVTGKEVSTFGDHFTNKAGRYHALVAAGSYKVLLGQTNGYYTEGWYGGAPSKDASPVVTVGDGQKVAGLNGTVTLKPTISGEITIDGTTPIDSKDRPAIDLFDPAGTQIDSVVSYGDRFSFVDLGAGTYTVVVRPSTKGSAYFTPVSTPVTLTADTAVDDLVVNATSIPGTAADKRSVSVEITKRTAGSTTKGKAFTARLLVSSYGDVAGGRLDIYVAGEKVASKAVPADGVVTWSTRFTGVEPGMRSVRAKFRGTDTTDARSVFLDTFRILR